MIRSLAITLFFVASVLASSGRAAALTLGDLFAGSSLTVDGIVYSDWQLLSPAAAGLGGISVVGEPGSGLRFDAAGLLGLGGVGRLDLDFGYQPRAGMALHDFALAGDGYLLVDQFVFGGASAAYPLLGANVTLADGYLGVTRASDDMAFAPLGDAYAVTRIRLAGTAPGDHTALRSFRQSWLTGGPATPMPEPGAPLLFAMNALLAGLVLRRRSRPSAS